MLEYLFQPVADLLGLPVDQARYVILLFINLPVAMAFRHVLHPSRVSLVTRHVVSTLLGLLICVICFDKDTLLLVGMTTISYALLHVFPPSVVQRYSMVWTMGALSLAHIYRTLTDWGGYHLDFSTPMMITTQKLSLVGFALHDGMGGNKQPLNKDQEHQKLKSIPSVLEYFSYSFNFHSILAGPGYTMREHLDFMEGTNLRPLDNPNQFARAKEHSREPSALFPVAWKFVLTLMCMAGYLGLSNYTLHLIIDPSYSFFYRTYILMMVTWRMRLGFYFIWILSDCINNAAGLGFSGYDDRGNAKWDLTTNIFLFECELAMSPRTMVNAWNVTTARWLRRVSYERITWQRSHLTFLLSAFWHGFYPAYYLGLVYLGFVVEASKKMRRLFNPIFTGHGLVLKWLYHMATWLFTQIFINFGAMSLQLMWLPPVMQFWRFMYFIPVVISVAIPLLLPSPRKTTSDERVKTEVAIGNSKISNGTSPVAIGNGSIPSESSAVATGSKKPEKQD